MPPAALNHTIHMAYVVSDHQGLGEVCFNMLNSNLSVVKYETTIRIFILQIKLTSKINSKEIFKQH